MLQTDGQTDLFFEVVQGGRVFLQFVVGIKFCLLCAQNVTIEQELPHELRPSTHNTKHHWYVGEEFGTRGALSRVF